MHSISTLQPAASLIQRLLLAWVLLMGCVTGALAQSEGSGSIRGVVGNPDQGLYFGQVIVSIDELNRRTTTDRDGRFRFQNVPAGTYTLTARYTGLAPVREEVEVSAGDVRQLEIALGGATGLDEIIVYGQRGQLAGSIARERAADNIISSITADELGRFPDQNVAEAVKRLSGMTVDRDKGEARFVVIRGADPSLNAQTINGQRINSPEADTRAVAFDVIPSELVEAVDVTKTSRPDLPADAIGGSVDIQTSSAFDREERLASFTGEASYDDFSGETSPKLSAAFSDTFAIGSGEDNLGVSLAFSWFDRDFGDDNSENGDGWSLVTDPETGEEFRTADEIEQRADIINRERFGATVNLDFRVSDTTDLYLRTMFSSFKDREISSRNAIEFDHDTAVSLDDRRATFESYEFVKELKDRTEEQQILSITTGGETLWNDWVLEYQAGFSHSEEAEGPRFNAEFVFEDEDIDGRTISYNQFDSDFYRVTSAIDNTEFEFDEASTEDNLTEDDEWSFRFDAERDMLFGNYPGSVRFGTLNRFREKSSDLSEPIVTGVPGDVTFADFAQGVPYELGDFGNGWNTGAWQQFFNTNRDNLEFDPEETALKSNGEDFEASEDVYAGYIMADADIGMVRLTGGVRIEHTDFEADGARIVETPEKGEFVESVSTDNSYTDVLPSLSVRYDIRDDLTLRGYAGQTIKRPNIEQIVPIEEANFEDREAFISNTDLDVMRSDNLDLMLSWYPSELSALSLGVFHKRISDFVVDANVVDQPGSPAAFDGFDRVVQPINGSSAELSGIELAWQQAFDNGFLIGLNGTVIDSEADLPLGNRKIPLPNQADATANAIFGYENNGWNLRLTAGWRDEFLAGLEDPADPAFDSIRDEHFQVDATVAYGRDNWEVKLEAANLNAEDRYEFFGDRRFNSEFERYEPFYNLGFTIDL